MKLKVCVPLPIRKAAGPLLNAIKKRCRPSPIDVVKANTKEAFEFFWSHNDFIAQNYLKPSRLAMYELVAEYCASVLMISHIQGATRVADIGCGTGHMLEALRCNPMAEYDVELFGLDFASSAIAKAKRLLPTATFLVEDIYENSLPSDFFDLILGVEILEHLRWPEKAVCELLRICKPKANVVVTVPNAEKDSWAGHLNFWSVCQLGSLLYPYGLVDIKLIQDDKFILARLVK